MVRLSKMIAVLLGGVSTAGCWYTGGSTTHAMAAPQRAAIVALGAAATYQTDSTYTDRQRLLVNKKFLGLFGTIPRYATDAVIEPVSTNHSSVMDSGMVVLRIRSLGGGSYPKWGLPDTGLAYVYLDSTGGQRALIVPVDPALPVTRLSFRVGTDVHAGWSQASARWLWRAADEDAWFACNMNRCCYVEF